MVGVPYDGGTPHGPRATYLRITSVAVAVWLRLPLVPPIRSVNVPSGVDLLVVTVIVEPAVAGFELNEAVACAGSPLALSDTAPVKPPRVAIAIE
jgi:hypothetical protein